MRSFASRGGWWVVGQSIVFAIAVTGAGTLDDPVGGGGAVRVIGWLLLGGGGALAIAGSVALGRNLTPFPAPSTGGDLIVHGVYAHARHPIYGGVVLGFVGLGLAANSVIALGCGVLLAPYFLAKSAFEERHLELAHPEYASYRRRVRKRLLPWII